MKLTIQNRQAAVEIEPSASALVMRCLKEPVRDRKKEKNGKYTMGHHGVMLGAVVKARKTIS